MKFLNLRTAMVVVGALIAGLLIGSEEAETDQDEGSEWAMFSQQGVGVPAAEGVQQLDSGPRFYEATSFLYNRRTGRVFRIFTGCGPDLGVNGCMEEIFIVPNTSQPSRPVDPSSVYSPNQIRR